MKGTNKTKRAHGNVNWYVSTFIEIFDNHKRINVCEHTVKICKSGNGFSPFVTECWEVMIIIKYTFESSTGKRFTKKFDRKMLPELVIEPRT